MVMWTNMLWHCNHIDVENMLTYVLYVEKVQEACVWQEHKGLEECEKRTCILQIKWKYGVTDHDIYHS